MTLAKINKCPRCKLPQNGMYRCQYCGYDLTKHKKKHASSTRKRLNVIFGRFKKSARG